MKQICLLLFLTANFLPAQKIVKKSIVTPEIKAININAQNSFELSVETAKGNEMVVEAIIDGEYKRVLLINVRESGETIMVSAGFQPNFKEPNDKLSAHKVISIALKVVLPEWKRITVFGTECNVAAKGRYRNLKITLNDGRCLLQNVSGKAEVTTQSGAISVAATKAQIVAKSKYGVVRGDKIPSGDNRYHLSSVTGNILLNKTD